MRNQRLVCSEPLLREAAPRRAWRVKISALMYGSLFIGFALVLLRKRMPAPDPAIALALAPPARAATSPAARAAAVVRKLPRRRVAAAAASQNTPALVAAGFGAVLAGGAADVAMEAAGVPPETAKGAVLLSSLAVTYGIAAQRFGGDAWEHSAEMMARSEAGLMGPTSERPPLQATQVGAAASAALKDDGVVRLDGVISSETASAARVAVIERLESLLSDWQNSKADRSKLGALTCRKNRFDVLLRPDQGAVEAAVREALGGPLGALLREAVGAEALLYELAASVSDEGAGRQPLQLDTPYQAEAPMYTAAVALQDVSVEMGPRLFLKGSHTETAYDDFMGGDIKKSALLERQPFAGAMIGAGDCAVFDSRLLYADAQNVKGRRVLLYFTFAKPGEDLSTFSPGSLAPEAQGRYRLSDFLARVST